MSIGSIAGMIFGGLAAASLAVGCISELLAARLAGDGRCDKRRLKKLYVRADGGNILAWAFFAAGVLSYTLSGGASDSEAVFEKAVSWASAVLLLADVYFLHLRRGRAPEFKKRK
jgi:hypothetical protein